MKTKCCFCKKDYETYPVILCDNAECFLMEQHIKLIYYDEKENEGVCKKCREKKFNNSVWLIKNWLPVRLQLECRLLNFIKEKDKKMIEVVKKSILRVKKIVKKLEKTPEVQALYHENNPAAFKEPLKNVLCIYCGEEDGEVWINNPNPPDFSKEKCWWVCKSCKEVIEIQQELVYASMFGNLKRAEELNNRLLKISKQTGRPILNAQLNKIGTDFEISEDSKVKETGHKYESSYTEFTGEKK